VVFEYPNISAMGVIDEANFDDQFDCSLGGAAHQGVFGPFGLLVLTDDDFQEQTAVFFYIAHKSDGQWTTKFCSDHSRSSLLHDVEKTVYGSDVTVLPTEDFLSLRVIVRFLIPRLILITNLLLLGHIIGKDYGCQICAHHHSCLFSIKPIC
jgi:hypothetical protein